MNPASLMKNKWIIVAAVVVALLLFTGLPAAMTGWNTDGEEEKKHGWTFGVNFDQSAYVGAWMDNIDSQPMTITGYAITPSSDWAFPSHTMTKYQYNLYNEETLLKSSEVMVPPHASAGQSVKFYMAPWTTSVLIVQDEARLTVKMHIWLDRTVWPYTDWDGERGWDGAHLYSGAGTIQLVNQGPFEEGSNAVVYVHTGYSGGKGWAIKLYPPADRPDLGTVMVQNTIADDDAHNWNIPIKAGYFKEGSSNQFRAELWNAYFSRAVALVDSIDVAANAPGKPTLKLTCTDSTCSVTATADATVRPIEKFRIYAWYGGDSMPPLSDTESWIKYNVEFGAASTDNDTYSGSYAFQVKSFKDGMVQIRVTAVDDGGRSSTPGFGQLKVIDGSIADHDDNKSPSIPFLWTTLVYLLIVAGAVIGGLMYFVWPGRPSAKGSAAMLVAMLFIGIAIYVGFTPSLAFMLG